MPQEMRVADRLHSTAIHLLRRLRREDDALGLSAARLSALSVIVFGGPLTIGELAAAEQVRPPTMTRIVAGLEADGLVSREAHETDRRSVRLSAKPKGRRILEAGRKRRVAFLAQRVRSLEERQLKVLEEATAILEELLRTPS